MKLSIAFLIFLEVTAFAAPLPSGTPTPPLKLPSIFSDHMVLQSGTIAPIWGWAEPGAAVGVQFINSQGKVLSQAAAKADSDGKWSTVLPPLKAGDAGKLHVTAARQSRDIEDVLAGETWLCGGQSNMVFPMKMVLGAKAEIEKANDPQLRLFLVEPQSALIPHDDIVGGEWKLCTSTTIPKFSAVAYYFGKHLRSSLNQPVGLIQSCVNGSKAQPWTSVDTLRKVPELERYSKEFELTANGFPGGDNQYQEACLNYITKLDQFSKSDKEYQNALAAWKPIAERAKREGTPAPPQPVRPAKPRPPLYSASVASVLFNGMIAPLVPYSIRGVIWFQADGNEGYPQDYGLLVKTLITDWRAKWKSELPFYYVEMNNMADFPQKTPVQYHNLCLIREQQQAALELPQTGVVCSIDLGLPQPERHFPNKKPVGDRLALLALNDLYNQKSLCNSPAYEGFTVEGNKIRIKLTNAVGLRLISGHSLAGFSIKAEKGDWMWAQGRIEGDSVLLWNDAVPQPSAARYAWAPNPVISVENKAGLPLRPFRTDNDSVK